MPEDKTELNPNIISSQCTLLSIKMILYSFSFQPTAVCKVQHFLRGT
jgi:hypothetical protein